MQFEAMGGKATTVRDKTLETAVDACERDRSFKIARAGSSAWLETSEDPSDR
jgi:hypothetical protein